MATIVDSTLPSTVQVRQLLAGSANGRVPGATYRLQFRAGFTFRHARQLVAYLSELGVTDIYASPYLKARTGSAHGYDVANPNLLNPEIGTEDEYRSFVDELARHDMGQVLDSVPNHMGIGDVNNVWWQDVLENGPSSVYASCFDIDWAPVLAEASDPGKVVLPVLGDQYGRVLENGELSLAYEDDGLCVHYYDFKLPLALESYAVVLGRVADRLRVSNIAAQESDLEHLNHIVETVHQLPARRRTDAQGRQDRNRQKELIKQEFTSLHDHSSAFRRALSQVLATLNGRKGNPRSYDDLDDLLNQQSYRLAFWRVAAEEINYRRFFDINDLAAVRVEDPDVFRATHQLLLVLVRLGAVTGIRIDHPDGLRDPRGHLLRLQRSCFVERNADRLRDMLDGQANKVPIELVLGEAFDSGFGADGSALPIYMVVEKILSPGEHLPLDWPVHGTTGYDFLASVNGVFVDRAGRTAMNGVYARFTGMRQSYADLANSTRKMVMLVSLPGEINGLAQRLKQLAVRDRRYRDFTLNALTFAVREFIACLPVYRTYIDPDNGQISDSDRRVIESTTQEVKRRNPRTDPTTFDFIRDQLLGSNTDPSAKSQIPNGDPERLEFVARFQQVSGPVMAKGVEDTAYYQYNRLVSLNEVGSDPDRFGVSVASFHRENTWRAQTWPHSMLATSTHDSKRGEDVRARINVLSEIPSQWRRALTRWNRVNVQFKPLVEGRPAPDRNDEYLLYQTLIGAWPLEDLDDRSHRTFQERITSFMLKAAKEAKVNTSWINPHVDYEAAVVEFVQAVLDRSRPNSFLDDFLPFQRTISNIGMFNSISQTLLKFASPGVADVYQGNEIWDFSLVDPDNRRPVDYKLRRQLLAEIRRPARDRVSLAAELLSTRDDGRIKLYVTHRCLAARLEHRSLFLDGGYRPLRAVGPMSGRVCAFARTDDRGQAALAIAPVLVGGLLRGAAEPVGEIWGPTRLRIPGRLGSRFRNYFTDELLVVDRDHGSASLPLASTFARFPVALLLRDD